MTERATRIETILRQTFQPAELSVTDESAMHAGHSGAQPGGETHYQVSMRSAAFNTLNRLARSRAVHAALAAEFAGGLHALSLRLRAIDEPG